MKIVTKYYKVYDFKELKDNIKQEVIDKWYKHEDYSFMSLNLTESLKCLLKENKIQIIKDLKLYYSLGYCQGDGICFIGGFKWKIYHISITHNYHYYHNHSTDIYIETDYSNEAKEDVYMEFKELYYSICDKIEKEGYLIIEHRRDFEEFNELCEVNKYNFLEDGKMVNY